MPTSETAPRISRLRGAAVSGEAESGSRPDTKERLLDAAERLFGERGFGGTSLRAITAAADVNVAAAHYHFGSKHALLRAVIERRVGPSNEARLAALDRLEARRVPPDVPEILDAFLRPVLDLERAPEVHRVSGMLFREPLEILDPLITEVFGPVGERFTRALEQALPELSPREIHERFQFVLGVMVQVVSERHRLGPGPKPPQGGEALLASMVGFLSAGLRAPAQHEEERE